MAKGEERQRQDARDYTGGTEVLLDAISHGHFNIEG